MPTATRTIGPGPANAKARPRRSAGSRAKPPRRAAQLLEPVGLGLVQLAVGGQRYSVFGIDLDRVVEREAGLGGAAERGAGAADSAHVTDRTESEAPAGGDARRLTAAERACAELVSAGASYAEIAACRGTTVRTVANQLASAYRKLEVNSRMELALRLRRPRR